MRLKALALALITATSAGAQATPTIDEFIAEISGREVQLTGDLFGDRTSYLLRTESGPYYVEFAVDRRTLERVRGCEQMMRVGSNPMCELTGTGEIRFENGSMLITLFDVTFTN